MEPSLTGPFAHWSERRADQAALEFADQSWTWAQFRDRVARLAAVLQRAGVGPGDRVAMIAGSSHRYVEYYYGTLWAGGIVCPLNARFALREIVEQTSDAEPTVLIVDDAFAAMAEPIRAGSPSIRTVIFAGDGETPAGMIRYDDAVEAATAVDDAGRSGDDVAFLFYTGGTTGRSKGVMLSHANLMFNAVNTNQLTRFDENLVHLHAGPLFHLGAGGRVFSTTLVGGRHVVLPRFTPADALGAISRYRITALTLVPTMLGMMLQHPDFATFDLGSLRAITYGAAPMPEPVLRRAIEALPNVRFMQSYGMTELSPLATFLTTDDHLPGAPQGRLRSAGRPVPNVEVRVADADDRTQPVGEVGEVLVRGPNVMLGYWRQPELTAKALRGGWMHTGDAGRFDEDGYLYVVDRTKDMIISGGENVYSTEVENALAEHPAVLQCAVIGVPHDKWGEAVHAIVVPRPGQDPEPGDLMAWCRTRIADYKCPRSIDFIGELPLSSVNKVDKASLRKPFWDGRERQVN